jgi:PAS domain S-box-containing protein
MTGRVDKILSFTRGVLDRLCRASRFRAEALRAESMLRDVVDSMPEGLAIFDPEGRMVTCNDVFRKIFYDSAAYLVPGARYEDLLRYALSQGRNLDAKGREEEWLKERLDQFNNPGRSFERRLADGRWLQVTDRRMRNGGIASLRIDITALKQAEAARRKSDLQLREAIEAIPEGFMLFDAEDRLVLSNSRLDELYPLTASMHRPGNRFEDMLRDGLTHKQFPDALGREDAWLAERLAARRSMKSSIEQRQTDGRWVLIDEHRTGDGGWVGTRRDITEIKQREAELRKAKEEAEVASRAKSQFLSHMSHELRTSLNAIIGFSDLIHREINGPVGHASYLDYAANIHTSGEHLLTVVNDILDLSKIEAGRLVLSEDEIELSSLGASVIRMLSEQAKAAGLTMAAEIDPHLPHLMGDERLLRQVILNLLGNAIKFKLVGGRVSLDAALDADSALTISVSDTGIGIAAEDLARIMEPFGQVDSAFNGRHQGTGLGLPIAKKLTEAMGGKLTIESRLKVGTRVTLRFPAERLVVPLAAAV